MKTIDYALQVATQLQASGKLPAAEIILQNIIAAHPDHAQALHLAGIIAHQLGKTDSALELLQHAIASAPTVALFHSNLGEIYRQLHVLERSIECGEKAIALDPNSAIALSNLGIAYYDVKQYDQAIRCHQRALIINPSLSCSLNNMGSIYKALGQTQKAFDFYLAATAATPRFVEPLNNLGVLLLEHNEFNKAAHYLQQAVTIAPNFVAAHCNLGFALLGLKQYAQARCYLEKTLHLKPDYAQAFYGMAKILLNQYDFSAVEQYLKNAIAINPHQVEFYQLLAESYLAQAKTQQAMAYLDQALLIDPAHININISKGSILMEMGEIEEAEAYFLKVAAHPRVDNRILAHYSLVQLRKIKPDSPSLSALLAIAANCDEVSSDKLAYLYFALGKCYDDLGEWSKAFRYFTQGCNLKRSQLSYVSAEQSKFSQKLINCFTQDTLEYLQGYANPSTVPIFIVGMPRSGSTLVEQILARHPQVYGAGELTYLSDLISVPLSHIKQIAPDKLGAITEQYLAALQRIAPHAKHITDKMPQNFTAVGFIHALFPNAKIIHIKRNPLDTCLSCYTKLFSKGQEYSYDLAELGQYYQDYKHIMAHWRRILPANAWLEIEYEAIIANLETEAKRLIAYCGLDWDPVCLAFYQGRRHVRTASFMQVRQPIYSSSVNRWRRFEKELKPLISALAI
jgi:tetratricopeptide (TPR) repeat protein